MANIPLFFSISLSTNKQTAKRGCRLARADPHPLSLLESSVLMNANIAAIGFYRHRSSWRTARRIGTVVVIGPGAQRGRHLHRGIRRPGESDIATIGGKLILPPRIQRSVETNSSIPTCLDSNLPAQLILVKGDISAL